MSTSTPSGVPGSTSDPRPLVISEDDVVQAISGGAGSQQGLTVEDLQVRFRDGKMVLKTSHLAYSMIRVQNLEIVGRLVAQGGKLVLEAESISPRGLVAAMIPRFAKQALDQFTFQWYVEEVEILDGQLRIRVR